MLGLKSKSHPKVVILEWLLRCLVILGGKTAYAASVIFFAFFKVAWLNLPLTRRELSTKSLSSERHSSAAFNALRGPPYFLSEKYLVNVEPERLRHNLQPWKAVVSYVNRVKFFFDFIIFRGVVVVDLTLDHYMTKLSN